MSETNQNVREMSDKRAHVDRDSPTRPCLHRHKKANGGLFSLRHINPIVERQPQPTASQKGWVARQPVMIAEPQPPKLKPGRLFDCVPSSSTPCCHIKAQPHFFCVAIMRKIPLAFTFNMSLCCKTDITYDIEADLQLERMFCPSYL